jgi:putative tryptophan/tyrosine transport system substrate-binding protein
VQSQWCDILFIPDVVLGAGEAMRRREFIALLGSAAIVWPVRVKAQQSAVPVIGFLHLGTPEANAYVLVAFRNGLSETGYVDTRDVTIEYRWADNDSARLPELAADLIRRQVSVIAVPGGLQAALAAKAETTTIPIVFSIGGDPVQAGLVASLNRPGGNVTGISYMNIELGAKRLGLLHELLPQAKRFGVLVDRNSPATQSIVIDLQAAALSTGQQLQVLSVGTNRDIDAAFDSLMQMRIEGLLISPQPLFYDRRVQLLTLAARHMIPTIYPAREWAEAGGMMSYGSSYADQFFQAGIYTGRVLKGEKPANLPVLRATKFEFILNLQTARALGFEIPATMIARADEVIE